MKPLPPSLLQVMPKFVPGQNVARVDLVPQWDTQHNSPAQSLTADVPYHELARRCVVGFVCRCVVGLSCSRLHAIPEMSHRLLCRACLLLLDVIEDILL